MNSPKILKRDAFWVAIQKPPGWSVYGESPQDRETNCSDWLSRRLNQKVYPIHRLDRDTCGVLVFALTPPAAALMSRDFQKHSIQKTYLAVVAGEAPTRGVIQKPLKNKKDKKLQKAETAFEVVGRWENDDGSLKASLLLLKPKTGRTHQIRRHLRSLELPILGDEKYGSGPNWERLTRVFKVKRTLLSAVEIRFPAPRQSKWVEIRSDPASDFVSVIRAMKLDASL